MITAQGSKTTATASGWMAATAQARLRECGFPELATLICDEYDGILRLRGTLSSAQRLQQAMAIIAAIPGVRGIDNRVVLGGSHASSLGGSRRPHALTTTP